MAATTDIERAGQIVNVEKQAIADVLINGLVKYQEGKVTPQHFNKFKKEWQWIIDVNDKYGESPTLETFKYQFPALELPEKISPVELIIDQLDRQYKFNVLAPAVNDLVASMRAGRANEGLETFISIVSEESGPEAGVIDLYKEASNRLKQYEYAVSNPEKAITYGYDEIDQITGGIWNNDFIIIAGRPGEGKSLVALDSARAVANQGYKVALFNGEMGNDELGYRLDTMESHLSNFALSNGIAGKDGQIQEKYRVAAQEIANKKAELLVLSRESSSTKITPIYLEKFCKRNEIDVLYIDQFSLLDSTSRFRETSEIRYELVRELKIVGKRLGIPIVLVAQLKRQDKGAKNNAKPGEPKFDTSDLSQTRGLEEFATVILMLEQVFERDAQGRTMLNLLFAKNRHGEREHILTYAWNIDKGERAYIKSNKPLPSYSKGNKPKVKSTSIQWDKEELPFGDDEGGLPY